VTNPSHEQLLLLYSTLDKLETDIDRMNQLITITLPEQQSNQNQMYNNGLRRNNDFYGYGQF